MKKVYLTIALILLLTGTAGAQDGGEDDVINGVSAERFAKLAKGINLSHWFWLGPNPRLKSMITTRFADADLELIRDLGFTHVRIPLTFKSFYNPLSDDYLNDGPIAVLDEQIARVLSYDLAVIVDLHSMATDSNSSYSGMLEADPEFIETFVAWWGAFAAHMSQYDPEMLFLEVLNEPVFYDNPEAWLPMQEKALAAMREAAPDHTLIASGAHWANIWRMVEIEEVTEISNVIYKFHMYDPFLFTHQGATWTDGIVKRLSNVPYPSTPENMADLVEAYGPDTQTGKELAKYGEERWNYDRMEDVILRGVRWAEEHGVRLICNEFGAHNPAPLEARARWLEDVTSLFEKYDIGWTMWEYDRNFGLTVRGNGEIDVIEPIAEALGLNMEALPSE